MAPEVFDHRYNAKCDIWSLGIMLYKMLTGIFPFKGDNEEQILNNIKVGQVNFGSAEWNNFKSSQALNNLIRHMLNVDPKERASAKEALRELGVWI